MRAALSNNALQLTSGGSMRASRASSMRRLQLSAVLCGRRGHTAVGPLTALRGRRSPDAKHALLAGRFVLPGSWGGLWNARGASSDGCSPHLGVSGAEGVGGPWLSTREFSGAATLRPAGRDDLRATWRSHAGLPDAGRRADRGVLPGASQIMGPHNNALQLTKPAQAMELRS